VFSWFRKSAQSEEGSTQVVEFRYDRPLLVITLLLIGFGLVMVYSASIVTAETQSGDGAYFFKRQVAYLVPGLGAMFVMANFHNEALKRYALPLVGAAALLLVIAMLPGISATAKGATRWIQLGPVRLQPSELVKLSLVTWMCAHLTRADIDVRRWRASWLPAVMVTGILAALLMKQPDFGSTVICGAMMMLLLWVAGGRHWHTGVIILGGIALVALAIAVEPYRMRRLTAFLSPESDPQGTAYQINQSLNAFGSGSWTGLGLGESRQKLLYLPDCWTDFVFAIIGEELGLVGVVGVMSMFLLFVWRGLTIARRAASPFASLLAFGITAQIGFQAVVNMAVVTALLPTKGLTLPFVSYGGSSLVVSCAAVGILLNISRGKPPPAWLHTPARVSRMRRVAADIAVAVRQRV
jgi:cell division protein FtsW